MLPCGPPPCLRTDLSSLAYIREAPISSTIAGSTSTETLSPDGSSCVLELAGGRLMRLTDGLNAFYSDDGGSTWSGGPLMNGDERIDGGRNYSLCRLGSGAIAILYNREERLAGRPQSYASCFRTSCDEGRTWSEESRIEFVEGVAWAWHDTMTVMPSGRIVIPFRAINASQYTRPTLLPGYGNVGGKRVAVEGHAHAPEMDIGFVMYSDDEGETWAQCDGKIYIWRQDGFGGMFPCDEPSIAPAGDGRLLMFMRTTLGVLYQSWSEDEGETWSMPEPTQLSSSYSPARLRAVPGTGDLVCVWNQVSAREIEAGGRRCRLSSAVSRDGGATWERFRTIEAGGVDRNVQWVRPPVTPSFVRSFDEVGDLPDDWGMFSYANLNFAAGHAFLEYEYRVGPYATDERDGRGGWKMGWKTQGRKRQTLPVDWFYSDD